ncbi:hypothetical protein HYV11_00645 [Candidatus Dependentiae bacterium]|nr:hypothetical protein [Candidatus Dependentiae bacterium]
MFIRKLVKASIDAGLPCDFLWKKCIKCAGAMDELFKEGFDLHKMSQGNNEESSVSRGSILGDVAVVHDLEQKELKKVRSLWQAYDPLEQQVFFPSKVEPRVVAGDGKFDQRLVALEGKKKNLSQRLAALKVKVALEVDERVVESLKLEITKLEEEIKKVDDDDLVDILRTVESENSDFWFSKFQDAYRCYRFQNNLQPLMKLFVEEIAPCPGKIVAISSRIKSTKFLITLFDELLLCKNLTDEQKSVLSYLKQTEIDMNNSRP